MKGLKNYNDSEINILKEIETTSNYDYKMHEEYNQSAS